MQVAISALYYDPAHFFATINNNPAVIGQFIEQWLNDTDCFVGIHDRKLCILGLCQLLTMPNVPGVPENAKRMIPSLIMLFEGLKRAYENAQETDDDDSDDGDDEDDDDDGEILNSDEDDIDEESAMYLENLQKKVVSASADGSVCITTSFAEDDDDDDDDEFYEESNLEGYTTPLDEDDAVDEYLVFKTTLEGLQASNPEWYAAVVGSLQQDQTKRIQDIFTLHQQRVAAKESKNIEKAGGYNFTQNTQVNLSLFLHYQL